MIIQKQQCPVRFLTHWIRTYILEIGACPYAKTAELAALGCYVQSLPRQINFRVMAQLVNAYSQAEQNEFFYDAIALQFPAKMVQTPADADDLVNELFEQIRVIPGNEEMLQGIDSIGWRLKISGTEYFAAYFGPHYPKGHSRHSGDSDVAWLMLQPGSSFKRKWSRLGINIEIARRAARKLAKKLNLVTPKETLDFYKILPKIGV